MIIKNQTIFIPKTEHKKNSLEQLMKTLTNKNISYRFQKAESDPNYPYGKVLKTWIEDGVIKADIELFDDKIDITTTVCLGFEIGYTRDENGICTTHDLALTPFPCEYEYNIRLK